MEKERVNQWIANILSSLYENFPKRIILIPSQIDKNADLQTQMAISDLIIWLSEERIIRFQERDISGNFLNCTLTMKGFMILNQIPQALEENTTLGEKLSKILKEGSINALNQTVNLLIQKFIGG